MLFIWFVTSWTHTFIMASVIIITYQRRNTLKYFIIQMSPLLHLHLLLTVIGTISLTWAACVIAAATRGCWLCCLQVHFHWAVVRKIPVHFSALYWTCDDACTGRCGMGMKDSARMATVVLAQLTRGWGSVRASTFLLWLFCLAGSFWNSMYVRWIWTQIVLWNKLKWQHLHTLGPVLVFIICRHKSFPEARFVCEYSILQSISRVHLQEEHKCPPEQKEVTHLEFFFF